MASETTQWRGQTWYFYSDYYRNREGKLLHREKYLDHHGHIPDGFDVHHNDEDPLNNEIGNLVALSRRDHLAAHGPRGCCAVTTEQRREAALRQWSAKEAQERICVSCGASFRSTGTRARFCSGSCAQQHWRDTHPGYYERYRAKREPKTPKPRPTVACAVCGGDFPKPADPRTLCCSRKCGYELRARRKTRSDGA